MDQSAIVEAGGEGGNRVIRGINELEVERIIFVAAYVCRICAYNLSAHLAVHASPFIFSNHLPFFISHFPPPFLLEPPPPPRTSWPRGPLSEKFHSIPNSVPATKLFLIGINRTTESFTSRSMPCKYRATWSDFSFNIRNGLIFLSFHKLVLKLKYLLVDG